MTLTMYDAIPEEIPNIPANPPAVAGYVDLHFQWSSANWARFPNAHHLTIAASSSSRARCLDVEPGDATASEAPGWYVNRADHSHGKPVLYTSASNVGALIGAMQRAGISRGSYLIWSAHYTHQAHICGPHTCGFPQADGTQWDDRVNGRSCDISLLGDAFFGQPAPTRAQGKANFTGSFDLGRGRWHVHGAAGEVTFSKDDRWASAEIQVNVRTGQWRIRPLPWDAKPLGR